MSEIVRPSRTATHSSETKSPTFLSDKVAAANVFDEPDRLADFAAVVSTGEVHESLVVDDRLQKTLLFLKKELINAQLRSKLSRDVDIKRARRAMGKDKLIQKFKERAASLKIPEGVRKVFEEELATLRVKLM